MTITVDITPEVQAALARQAATHGRAVEAYAASLLEEAVRPAAHPAPTAEDMVELFAPVRGLFADGELDFSRNPSISRPIDLS
jgi:plasmid stability protein